jgi:hypothetical protein
MRGKNLERTPMLTAGNAHLGPLIHTFSIPASSTCPGATPACLRVCYAREFLFLVRTNLARHTTNRERAGAPGPGAADRSAEIRWKRVKILRIHVAGDFFDAAYIRAWIRIASSCKRVKFLFYTRSWRVPELRPHLIELAWLPNVFAHWSEDRDTGPADLPVGRRCFLCAGPADEALVPPGVLVFRDDEKVPRKWINGSWVCPKEQGTEAGVTCSSCLRCLVRAPWPLPPGGRIARVLGSRHVRGTRGRAPTSAELETA